MHVCALCCLQIEAMKEILRRQKEEEERLEREEEERIKAEEEAIRLAVEKVRGAYLVTFHTVLNTE